MKKKVIILCLMASLGCKQKTIGVTYEDYPVIARKWTVIDWDVYLKNGKGIHSVWETVKPEAEITPPKKVKKLIERNN